MICGICGFNWSDNKLLKQITKLLTHRGPDDEGHYSDSLMSLGHKRLSIIDLSKKGKQPMTNKDESIIITFNGEIFNFQELRDILKKKGYSFSSKTDTEVIIYAYEEFGIDCINYFNGQFAFCIYDTRKKILFAARDRLGIKPFCYYSKNDKFIFSSELKSILKSGIVKKTIDKTALNHYLIFGYTSLDQTIIKDVKKLKPGHFLIYDLSKKRIKQISKYWTPSFNISPVKNENELKMQIIEKFDKSVRYRLISDRPVGAFLSGGIDSSLIVAFMSKYVKKLETFSISFDYDEFDEAPFARQVSKKFNTNHHEMKFTTKDVIKLLPKTVYYFDEPFSNCSVIPTLLLAKVAKRRVTVSLSGTGGDELFAGYKRHLHYNYIKLIVRLPISIRKFLFFSLKQLGKISQSSAKLSLILENSEKEYTIYPKLFSYFNRKLLGLDVSFFTNFKKYFKKRGIIDAFNFDQKEYLPLDLLYKEDIACLGHSLEGRFPFLDHNFVDFANKIPINYKLRKNKGKYILKKVAEEFIPKNIIYRKKQSFMVPFKEYFKKDLKNFAYNNMFNFNEYNYYDKSILKKCWKEHQLGKKDHSDLFLTIIMFNLWYKKWMS